MTANSAFLGTLYAQIAVNTTALDHAAVKMQQFASRADASMLRVQKSAMAAGAAMKTFGRSMTQFVTVPMALVGGASLKMYADFEFSMNKVVSLVGVARSQVDEWSESILKLAPTLGKSPRELADAMYFVTSAGIRGAEAMDVLEESAKSSAAGLGETKVVADLLTSVMNAYGKENITASRANDILVATVREGKAEANLLAQSLGLVLPIASAMGAEFTDVGAATAAMTRTGTKAATAAIQLRQMFNSILKPAKEAEQALVDMGISSDQLRKIIKEGSLLDALKKLDAVTKGYGVSAVGKVIPNIRSLTGFLDIMGKNLPANEKLWKSIENSLGDANATFQQTAETVKFRLTVAMGRLTTSGTIFGESLSKVVVPILERLAGFVEKLVTRFDNLTASQKRFRVIIGVVVGVLGPFLTILGFLVGNALPGLIMLVRGATKAITFMGLVIKNNPLGLLVTAVTTLISLYAMWKIRINQVAAEQNSLNAVMEGAVKSTQAQRTEIEELYRIATDMNRAEEIRVAAIKALNDLSPAMLGHLNKQNIATATGTKAVRLYTEELLRQAKAKVIIAELEKLEVQRFNEITMQGAKVLTFWQKMINFAQKASYSGGAEVIEDLAETFKEANLEKRAAEITALKTELQELLDATLTDADFGTVLGTTLDDLADGVLSVSSVMTQYNAEMGFAMAKTYAFGSSVDTINLAINAHQQAIEGLLRAGVNPLSEDISVLIDRLRLLELALSMRSLKEFADGFAKIEEEIVKIQDTEFDEMFLKVTGEMQKEGLKLSEEIEKSILKYHGLIEESGKTVGSWTAIIRGAFTGMANVITNALNSSENVLQAFGKFFGDFMKGMIIKLIAATAAALALAVVLTFIIPGKSAANIFSSLTEGFKFMDAFKAGFKSFTRLQHGGIVPPGYPNDSFPALLTSGEKIIPAHRQIGSDMGFGEVRFEIEGDVLMGILRKRLSVEGNL